MPALQKRVDEGGRAYAGSQLQIQIYANRRSEELSQGVSEAFDTLPGRLRWASPLEAEGFVEYRDRGFLRAVGLEKFAPELSRFWPRWGPVWDGLAALEVEGAPETAGIILVEAKSYPVEIFGGGCQAGPRSRQKIEEALNRTRHWLGVVESADWTGPLYQSANRLAHLFFFREIVGIPAWLVNIYFLNDPHSPTSREEWQVELVAVKQQLGLAGITIPHYADMYLAALPGSVLVSDTQG
jgi:hypothetical protein